VQSSRQTLGDAGCPDTAHLEPSHRAQSPGRVKPMEEMTAEVKAEQQTEALTSVFPSGSSCVQPSRQMIGVSGCPEVTQPGRPSGWTATVQKDEQYAQVKDSAGGEGQWEPGMRVQLHGLTQRSEINGKIGVLLAFDSDRGRWQVRCSGLADTLRCKPSNLRIAPD